MQNCFHFKFDLLKCINIFIANVKLQTKLCEIKLLLKSGKVFYLLTEREGNACNVLHSSARV